MPETVLILFVGLELKHYFGDYLLQPVWLLKGKGDLRAPGGYVHAAIHAVGSLLVFFVAGIPIPAALLIVAAEFVVHYTIDFVKYRYGGDVDPIAVPWRFWALHGFDQLLHQLTYAVMVFAALWALA